MARSILNFVKLLFLVIGSGVFAANPSTAADQSLDAYFKSETAYVSSTSLSNVHSLAEWQERRPELRREAAEMLGLDPMPERSPLSAVITGKLEEKDLTVEKLYFQSRPHLYVTADLYLPKSIQHPAPAVLYLCGHSPVISNGVSFGNKAAYQYHGIWFARHGYVCLIVDTLQYGEIQGHHRGTYDENQWWWNSRGFTPAGIETWNAIRALDYLDSRPEVDTNRIGVTGRSGGGAYSWFLAAVDDRVKVIAPVAGITDLQNYVVDGAVDEHCDCMFMVNTYRWDYPLLAALCAPRPLLLGNADADQLFPLDGVMRTRNFVKQIYDLYGAATNFGMAIGPGPHKDTPELQVSVFHWLNLHLKGDPLAAPIESAGPKLFSPQELKVFDTIPADQINSTIQESFVPGAKPPEVPTTADEWQQLQKSWIDNLRAKCFAGWPAESEPTPVKRLFSKEMEGIQYEAYEIQSQTNVMVPVYLMHKAGTPEPHQLDLYVADDLFANTTPGIAEDLGSYITKERMPFHTGESTADLTRQIQESNIAVAVFCPRDTGASSLSNAQNQITLRRKFMLLGQTLDGMRVWDIHRAVEALRSLQNFRETPICLHAKENMGVNALYASLFTPNISSLDLRQIPGSQRSGPDYLNVLKILDLPEATAMAASHCQLQLQSNQEEGWEFLRAMEASPAAKLTLKWLK